MPKFTKSKAISLAAVVPSKGKMPTDMSTTKDKKKKPLDSTFMRAFGKAAKS